MLTVSKEDMLKSLPIIEDKFTIRTWNPKDLDKLAKWQGYPFPYEPFNFSFGEMSPEEKDRYFRSREDNPNRVTLIVDHMRQQAMGYLSLVQIDWVGRKVGNMGFRVVPSWCNQGVGTWAIRKVSDWCLRCGLQILCLDVAASNNRAIRCYEKAGFIKTEEFWREDEGLKDIDIDQPQYEFLRPHVRLDQKIPQLCFWWMELKRRF
jgi:RimJ/RimL family protein N-acetyltransferase